MASIKEILKDKLVVKIFDTRDEMGKAAGCAVAEKIKEIISEKGGLNMIFAAAPSQNETLATLVEAEGIDWGKVNAFHMDEYIGLSADAPQGFGNFLKDRIFSKLAFKSVNYIYAKGESAEETCERYTKLIKENPIDIVCLGIGENGHIAFNDPWVADFNDSEIIKKVALDDVCRQQQVNDGCFEKIDDVPKYALTLTVPTLFNADYLFCTVPAKTKSEAVYKTVNNDINEDLPATIMRNHNNAIMYCDADSGEKLL
ncbi:MAG: glucosamine-6-phosphate deaminase [Clostridia bacterium]|nr:glucosamine-6-phosphate deaminase [Clostridia bacterium]